MTKKNIKKNKNTNFTKHSKEHLLKVKDEDLRWATNEIAANWRATRLKCDRIADLGCGIGFQSFSFAKKCSTVIAIDLDADKINDAKKSAKKLNISNVEFSSGDIITDESISKTKGCQVIFLDPQRDPTEDARKIESIKPNIKQFLEKYNKITDSIAIEFPPQIKEFPQDCEKEYLSINGKLNRLTLYFGKLKTCEVSAVCLPEGKILKRDYSSVSLKGSTVSNFIYEIDHAVQKANLLSELTKESGAKFLEEKKYAYFTSEAEIKNPFFKTTYKVIEICDFEEKNIINHLKKHGFGKVLVRYEVAPEEYWNERNKYERELHEEKLAVLFKIKDKAIICQTIK